jgi:hypothetical protein
MQLSGLLAAVLAVSLGMGTGFLIIAQAESSKSPSDKPEIENFNNATSQNHNTRYHCSKRL